MRAIWGEQNIEHSRVWKDLSMSLSLVCGFFFFGCCGGEGGLSYNSLTLSSEANFFIITIHINKNIYQKNEPKIQKGLLQNSNSPYSFSTLPPYINVHITKTKQPFMSITHAGDLQVKEAY